ncbi:MAG: APC family permease [Clostridiales bacterium]|jgi:amino acid transporter|nr:APC family permease [Clostridiales bacterium]
MPKKLGLPSAVAVCMGLIVATSCLVSLGQGIGLSGSGFILPLMVVMVLNGFVAMSFAELHQTMPRCNGGIGQYTYVGLGPWTSIVSNVSAYIIMMVFASATEVTMCGGVLNSLFPAVNPIVFSLGILAALFAINLFGVDIFAKVQLVTVGLLIFSMAALGVIGFFGLGAGTPVSAAEIAANPPPIQGAAGLLGLSALAFYLFIGVEFVIPVANDMKNPKRNVLLAMLITLVILCAVQGMLGMGMMRYVPLNVLRESGMPHMEFATNMLGNTGKIWMAVVSALASISSINTILPSTGKVLQGMAEESLVPAFFKKTTKYNAAWPGMLLLFAIIAMMLITGYVNSTGLINMLLAGSCFWLTSYILVHLTAIALRRRYPNIKRNKWLMLGELPQIIGIIGCAYMIWNISSDPTDRMMIFKTFGILLGLLAVYAAVWVGVVKKGKLFKPEYVGRMNIRK